MTLQEQYKEETGEDAMKLEEYASTDRYGKNHECYAFTDEYVEWLEEKLEGKRSNDESSKPKKVARVCPCCKGTGSVRGNLGSEPVCRSCYYEHCSRNCSLIDYECDRCNGEGVIYV